MTVPQQVQLEQPCPTCGTPATWAGKQIEPGGTRWEIDCPSCDEPAPPIIPPPINPPSSLPVSLARNALYLMQLALQRRTA